MTSLSNGLLRMRGITKDFGATRALENVNFELEKGEVHALLGENGAGKSTLIKILSGAVRPDGGLMDLEGQRYSPSNPLEGRKRGVSVIYQELNLAPHLTVEGNIILGREEHTFGFLAHKRMKEKVDRVLARLRHPEISPDIPVRKLGLAARQIVEIARALSEDAKILVMDEPTSSLSQEDSLRLFETIKGLKSKGVSILYISHFLEEVQKVADRYTVLRDGRNVGTGKTEETTLEELIGMMVGQEAKEMFPRLRRQQGEEALSLEKLRGKEMPAAVDLILHRGEILGLAGLVGSGRTEILRTVFGLDKLKSGIVRIKGVRVLSLCAREMISRGAGFLSEDRQGEGLTLGQSVADNLVLSRFSPYLRFGFLSVKDQEKSAWEWMQRMKIKSLSSRQPVSSLSGGNQQKVAIARLLHQEADVLLLDEPTRGIDIVTKFQIYEWMRDLARRGKAILCVSSYFPELQGICDRIAVFHRGRLVECLPSSCWNDESLLAAASTGKRPNSVLESRG